MNQRSVAEAVAETTWYHSVHLPGGLVTPGEYDHTPIVAKLPFPESLSGRRCLDVGTHDGFWAFEMERRGAADVMAIDLDDPTRYDWPEPAPVLRAEVSEFLAIRRRAFNVARDALASKVDRRNCSVYDLDPDEVGEFDFAFMGSLLHHLRDPIGALMAVRRVVRGQLLLSALISPSLSLLHPRTPATELMRIRGEPFWEVPNLAGVYRQLEMAGWRVVSSRRPHLQRHGAGWQHRGLDLRPRHWVRLPQDLLIRFRGAPHVGLLAEPVR